MLRDPRARGPNSIRPWNQPTTCAAAISSATAAHLITGVVYFAVVTPIGLVSRLARGDTLHRKPDRNERSYWIEWPRRGGTRRYLRQF